jgi:hypothetical protein
MRGKKCSILRGNEKDGGNKNCQDLSPILSVGSEGRDAKIEVPEL